LKNSFDKSFGFAAAFLALVITISYGYCLSGYFLADDTWQVQFAYRVMNGEAHLLFDNFAKSYLGVPSLDFYRPLLGFTYLSDYLIYGLNPWGYYLTNLILAWLAAVFFFMSVRVLTKDFGSSRSFYCAVSAAALFASSPLHCEDICWISGRADLLAAVFYLPSLYLAIRSWQALDKSDSFKFYSLSLGLYVLSLLSKESAVGLPIVIASLPLVCKRRSTEPLSRKDLKAWLMFTLPYFLLLVPYFIVRTIALGDPIGGYSGDMGKALTPLLFYRWVDPITFFRLVFPLPYCIFPQPDTFVLIIECFYAVIFGLFIVRLVTQRINWHGLAFVAIMTFQALLPLYKLWGLDQDLHNQRIYYFFTLPMALFLPLLVFAPKLADRKQAQAASMVLPQGLEAILDVALAATFAMLALLFAAISFAVTASWVDGGSQVRELAVQSAKLVSSQEKPVIVLGIPKNLAAAHILLFGLCYRELLEPPFMQPSISNKVLTFHSSVAGPEEPINSTRFKQVLLSNQACGPYVWSVKDKCFNLIKYRPLKAANDLSSSIDFAIVEHLRLGAVAPLAGQMAHSKLSQYGNETSLSLDEIDKRGGVLIEGLDVDPLQSDYLSFDVALQPGFSVYAVAVQFDDLMPGAPFVGDSQVVQLISIPPGKAAPDKEDRTPDGRLKLRWAHINVHLSHYWRWYGLERIRRIKLIFSGASRLALKNVRLTNDLSMVPGLSLQSLKVRPAGDYVVGREPLHFSFNASNIPKAARMQLVISQVNESFDNFLAFDRRAGDSVVAQIFESDHSQGLIELPASYYQINGYYEIKARALDDFGRAVGDWSDVVTIYRPSDKGPAAYYAGN
jgi:hypothetical protein